MRKLLRTAAAFIASLGLMSGVASAQTNCIISGTGSGSTTSCSVSQTTNCTSTNTNNSSVTNNGSQNAGSGSATSSGNAGGGSATSGDATNDSDTSTVIDIVNGNACAVAAANPPTEGGSGGSSVPAAPSTGGSGNTAGGRVAGASTMGSIAALPETSAASPLPFVVGAAGGLGVLAIASQLGARLYTRFYCAE